MIALDPRTTALVLIDLQNGVLGRKLAPISADELVARGKALAEKFRAAGALVVLVNAALRAENQPRAVDEPSQLPEVLPAGFIDLVPGLAAPGDILITKSTWAHFPSPNWTVNCASVACGPSCSAASPPNSASNPPRDRHGSSVTNW
jgi:nicotinamidase-related amidase